MKPMRIAYFASGNGSTFQYIAERISSDKINAVSALLLSSSKTAHALNRAKGLGIKTAVVRQQDFKSETAFFSAMLSSLQENEIDFICLAGYMKLVPHEVVRAYSNRILNVHPALLPAFGGKGMYGRRVHEAVIASKAGQSGATIHLVNEEYDRGSIVAQQTVPVSPDDTPAQLEERVHRIETELYYKTLLLFIQNRVEIRGQQIRILPPNTHD